jgi:hypothetical protein
VLDRRGFLRGLIGALAAPAIIRTPGLLMPVKPLLEVPVFEPVTASSLLTINMITREAVRLYRNANAFLQMVDLPPPDARIGSSLPIRLPDAA